MRGVKKPQHQRRRRRHLAALHIPSSPSASPSVDLALPAEEAQAWCQAQAQAGRRRNMKQASLSAFSALDLRQTSNSGIWASVAAESDAADARRVGNRSRARSRDPVSSSWPPLGIAGAPSTFRPAPPSSSGRQVSGLEQTVAGNSRPKSERPTKSFESEQPLTHGHHHHHHHQQQQQQQRQHQAIEPSFADDVSQRLIFRPVGITSKEEEEKGRKEEELKMQNQTMQSIQSLSMQLNRAASLSASLDDDSMSVSQDISSSHQANASGGLAGGKRLTKLVGKKAGRMKEILLQNLGKAHKTTDELFEMYEENFHKQQAQALKIQKEFKTYMSSLKGAQDAGKNLNACIQQSTGVYQSARHDLVCENLAQLEILNEDLLDKLRGQIQASLSEYMSQFSELRDKISKRKRKLIDYDSSRRVYEITLANVQRKRQQQQPQNQQQHYQALRSLRPSFKMRSSADPSPASSPTSASNGGPESIQSAASQLVDEARLLKLREQYNYCKIMFETINSELYQELPMVYEKKMKHLLMTLQNYFSLEAQYHANAGKLFSTAGDVIDELPMSIHRSQQHNPLSQQQQQQQPTNNKAQTSDSDDYINHKVGGSSGMGSSRGDSSLESSSSPDNSVNGSSSPVDAGDCVMPLPQVAVNSRTNFAEANIEPNSALELDSISANNLAAKEPVAVASGSVSTIDVLAVDGGGTSCQLDSLSMDFGDSSVSDSVDTNDLDAFKEQQQGVDDDDQQASTSEGSSCSVIEKRPDAPDENAAPLANKPAEGCCAGPIYKVRTSYKYLAEDVDELCFEADEIIQVVEFDENQEQEEGWLMGVREVNGQRGLFPANFTKPV